MSRRTLRLVVIPVLLLLGVSGLIFGIALEPPAQSEAPTAAEAGTDPVSRGELLFAENCAACHGDAGRNASLGPDLAGNPISIEDAREQIETGGGGMPAGLVEGQDLEDVLAYLDTIRAGEPVRGED
jgi:mono/diheme cytochrome c family protein